MKKVVLFFCLFFLFCVGSALGFSSDSFNVSVGQSGVGGVLSSGVSNVSLFGQGLVGSFVFDSFVLRAGFFVTDLSGPVVTILTPSQTFSERFWSLEYNVSSVYNVANCSLTYPTFSGVSVVYNVSVGVVHSFSVFDNENGEKSALVSCTDSNGVQFNVSRTYYVSVASGAGSGSGGSVVSGNPSTLDVKCESLGLVLEGGVCVERKVFDDSFLLSVGDVLKPESVSGSVEENVGVAGNAFSEFVLRVSSAGKVVFPSQPLLGWFFIFVVVYLFALFYKNSEKFFDMVLG